ncbi:nitroreductase family protein [Heliomicrobium modesticaldum Ice1]|uniref:Nitroreductase family protein n=1 Tax=Heliobacterium modesticaldum (strain ATCC 51547 / Ice1) TaxID=498761 RepID=B0TE04_HELMI|nr:nitroreductase [Heliomicrobium modesticaldum]ABZ84199.1 nitroreductase family protein [Heliomicrobium modesticaldum Ice1]
MELREVIYGRRSVRKYTAQKVERQQVEALLEAAVQAPSAMNSQPWAFVVIQDEGQLKAYSDQAKAMMLALCDGRPLFEKYRSLFTDPDYNIFYDAATLIVVYAKPAGPNPTIDCALAAQNIMLAARDMGLGSCWIGFALGLFNDPAVKADLGVPEGCQAVAPLIVGYPQGEFRLMRKKAPEVIAWLEG